MRVGVAVVDLFTGLYTCVAILAALYRREKSGEGAHIDMALVRHAAGDARQPGVERARLGQGPAAAGQHAPEYRALSSCSTRPISRSSSPSATTGNSPSWRRCAAIRNGPATNASRATARESPTAPRSFGWSATASAARARPSGWRSSKPPAFPQDRSIRSRRRWPTSRRSTGRWCGRLRGMPLVGSPVRLDGARADSDLPPPALGEHTREVLAKLGLEPHEIARLKSSGVIG